jgi:hypothetical protein
MARLDRMAALLAFVFAGCGAFGAGEEENDPSPPVVDPFGDATPPDRSAPDAASLETGCRTANEQLVLERDALLNFTTEFDHQDLSAEPICNLAQMYCLVAFQRVLSLGKPIVSLALSLRRATSSDCPGVGGCSSTTAYHEAGKLVVRQVRPDWLTTATWYNRTKYQGPPADDWSPGGALGPPDSSQELLTKDVGATEDTVLMLDGTKLVPALSSDPVVALHIQGTSAAGVPGLQFVVQRKKGTDMARPTLTVTYCAD